MHYYHAFGLRIGSDLQLPELHPGSGPADVEIRYGESARSGADDDSPWFEGPPGQIVIRLENIRFTIAGGRSVDIDAPRGTPPADTRVWLLGTVMAAVLHQRGYLPVHANVVAMGGGIAAAFAGDSGAGKSTLAAWFERRGHRVLADDLCAILPSDSGVPQLFEGIPRVKLWSDALDAFGRSRKGLDRVASTLDKYQIPLGSSDAGSLDPLTLERIYILDRAADDEPAAITRLAGAEAANAVLSNAFRWELGQAIKPRREQFDQCLALARHAAIFRIKRHWGFAGFDSEAEAIERHLGRSLTALTNG